MSDAMESTNPNASRGKAFKKLSLYGLARLALFLGLFFVLLVVMYLMQVQVPAAITAVLALIIAMPLSVFAFPGLRQGANEAVAEWTQQRREHKEYMRKELAERENL
ncbi:DUF4229 domain-containing protein [Corynebacterium sp. H113]|uniref:DUF4229 domain-containing protein n=1 Tax=Corynebacterium sp. H113 TaxID=3133419 RepID=UPI0030990480